MSLRNICRCGKPVSEHDAWIRAGARAVSRLPVDVDYRAAYEIAWQAVHARSPRSRPYDVSDGAYAAMDCAYQHPKDQAEATMIRTAESGIEKVDIKFGRADNEVYLVHWYNGRRSHLEQSVEPGLRAHDVRTWIRKLKAQGYTKTYDWSAR